MPPGLTLLQAPPPPGFKKLYTPLQSRMQNDALKTYDNLMTA